MFAHATTWVFHKNYNLTRDEKELKVKVIDYDSQWVQLIKQSHEIEVIVQRKCIYHHRSVEMFGRWEVDSLLGKVWFDIFGFADAFSLKHWVTF